MSIARQRVEDVTTRTGDELSRRLRESIRSVAPRSGGITGLELDYLAAVIGPVVAGFVREMRSADAKLTAQVEHLKRRVELLDIRLRAPNENRSLKKRLFNLELEVSLLRRAAKK